MAKELNILYGFKYARGENGITKAIESYGYVVNSAMRYSKASIKGFIENTPKTDIVVLKEYLEGGEEYSPEELAQLADDTNARFIVLLHPKNRGRAAMKTIYMAGILDAVFADKKMGAAPDFIASLVVKGRKRREAREYYRITDMQWPDYGFLTLEQFSDALQFLEGNEDDGREIIERFNDLSMALSKRQFIRFVNRLPEEDMKRLQEYELFYDVMESLRRGGYTDKKYKKPKDVKKTLPEDAIVKARTRFMREDLMNRPKTPPVLHSVQIDDQTSPYNNAYRGVRTGRAANRPQTGPAVSGTYNAPSGAETVTVTPGMTGTGADASAAYAMNANIPNGPISSETVFAPNAQTGRQGRRRRRTAPQGAYDAYTSNVPVNRLAPVQNTMPVSDGYTPGMSDAEENEGFINESAPQETYPAPGANEAPSRRSSYRSVPAPQEETIKVSDYKTVSNETITRAEGQNVSRDMGNVPRPVQNGASEKPNASGLSSMDLDDLISQYQ